MASGKKVLLKVIILGDSGSVILSLMGLCGNKFMYIVSVLGNVFTT